MKIEFKLIVTISNYGWQQSEIAEILRVSASLLYIFNIPLVPRGQSVDPYAPFSEQ